MFSWKFGSSWNITSILRTEHSFQRDEESVCGRRSGDATGRQGALLYSALPETPPAESAVKKRQCVRNHRPHKREDCATRAKAGEEVSLEFGGEPEEYSNITYQREGTIIVPVDSARGGLVREVPPAEEPAERLRRSASVKGATGRRTAMSAPSKLQP